MIEPYYKTDLGVLYCGDCLEIMPELEPVDLVLTDPPYDDYEREYSFTEIMFLKDLKVRQFLFWSRKSSFPLDYTAIHIWNKNPSNYGAEYERIFERNGHKHYKVFTYYMVNSTVAAQMTNDIFTGHPDQKPIKLMRHLVDKNKSNLILDPFLGSGTTAVACERLGRRWIGIEISEEYCAIAKDRIEKEAQQLKLFPVSGGGII